MEKTQLKAYRRAKNTLPPDPFQPRKKKGLGQHFLRKQSVVDNMIEKVKIGQNSSVFEIGCGDGFLTQSILLQTPCERLWCFEIDPEWIEYTGAKLHDERLTIHHQNILDLDFAVLEGNAPWVLLANLPYQITFPILFLLQQNKHLLSEGVVMMQEEVAQKIVAKEGRSYSRTSLFLQRHFHFELMEKIEPGAFTPPPKVNSRLLYFKPKLELEPIPNEKEFWKFIKACFISPRRTLRNNLKQAHYDPDVFGEELLRKRAQELSFDEFLVLWDKLSADSPSNDNS